MLSAIEGIVEAVILIPQYILFAIESLSNLFMEGIQSLFEAATSLIELPATPTVPSFIAAMNWFFPIGAVVSIMTPIVAGYVTFLAIRWIYQKVGDL